MDYPTNVDRDSYEAGYEDGSNSVRFDWELAFDELLDMDISGMTAWQVAEKLKRKDSSNG